MIAKVYNSNNPDVEEACSDIIERVSKDFDEYDFVMVALSPKYDIEQISNFLNKNSLSSKCLMFHAIDAFCNTDITQNGITALFLKFERNGSIDIFYRDNLSTNYKEIFKDTISYLKNRKDSFHIIIAGVSDSIAPFIEEIGQSSDININNIQGGLSSGELKDGKFITYQFYDKKIIKDGFVIISLDNISIYTSISMGFEPVGVNYTITKSHLHSIYNLDNSPVKNIVKRLSRGIDDFKFEYLYYTPLVLLDESNQELLTLRTFRQIEEDGAVSFWGPIKDGQKVRLTYGESETLLNADRESAKSLYNKLKNPDLILNFSCIAREYVLENNFEKENQIYIDIFNAPLFGFFTFGEIGHAPNRESLQFYNETSLLTVIREK